jgi:hypothetical protein
MLELKVLIWNLIAVPVLCGVAMLVLYLT